jgi:flagellar biosynthetic protein FliR
MQFNALTYEAIYVWLLVFVRASGLLVLMPVLSGPTVPSRLRMALAALLAVVFCGMVKPAAGISLDLVGFMFAVARELMLGMLMGAVGRFIFYAIEFAGHIISTEIGLLPSSQMDPVSQSTSTPVGSGLTYLAMLLFLVSEAHHLTFAAFLRSFEIAPLGQLGFDRNISEMFVASTGNIFLVAAQMAAPIMAVNFVVTFTFAILGKAAPSINVFSESASVRILVGLGMVAFTLGLTAQLMLSYIRQSPELMLKLLP